jgi:hypothetical protein
MTWDDLYERAGNDHERWRGKAVFVTEAGVSNENDILTTRTLPSAIGVRVDDCPLDTNGDCTPHRDDGGLLDTYYPASSGLDPQLGEFHVWWIDGPTYYLSGRVEYPGWWPTEGRGTE